MLFERGLQLLSELVGFEALLETVGRLEAAGWGGRGAGRAQGRARSNTRKFVTNVNKQTKEYRVYAIESLDIM